jgi:hypothetical protein
VATQDKLTEKVAAEHIEAPHPEERAKFKSLILANPNYFGNLAESGFKAVKAMNVNTTYEQLMCIGLQPDADKLEAVVNIKRHTGYNSDACSTGSREYVRFFVQHGATWVDLGSVSFTAYDTAVTSPLPLSYSVQVDLDEVRKYCNEENFVNVRGILSWTWEPPAGNASWMPPWGNVVNVRVQIAPKWFFTIPLGELIKDKQLELKPDLLSQLNLDQTLQVKTPIPKSYAELKAQYANQNVPGHRIGFTEAHKLLQNPITSDLLPTARPSPATAAAGPSAVSASLLTLGPELGAIIAALQETQGDTTFEQLDCVGYNPETRMLGGVITLKQSGGYLSGLCDAGSTEYVGFWLNYGGTWHSLGVAQVQVHDLPGVTASNPLQYAVFRGVNVPEYLCNQIAGLPLRAILSWQSMPTDPNTPPVWGNVVDTYIQPIIGDTSGQQRVRLMRINRVGIGGISDVAEDVGLGPMIGLADPTGDAQDCNNANDSPFGGPIFIEGDFTIKSDAFFNPTNGQVLPGAKPLRYTVQVEGINPVSPPVQLTNSFGITVFPANPPIGMPSVQMTQSVANVNGLSAYTYMEGMTQAVNPRTLAVWDAGGLAEGQYRITVTGFEWNGATYAPLATGPQTKDVYVYNGYPHTELVLVNGVPTAVPFQRPQVALHISSPSGDCGDVAVGDTLQGTFSVTDRFFGSLSIALEPITINGIPQPLNPVQITVGGVVQPDGVSFRQTAQAGTTGMSGTWSLSTAGMTPCGYTIVLSAWDRALVGDSCVGHYNQIGVGFCLRAAGT